MVRVKRGVAAHKRRKNVIKQTKGYRWSRKSKFLAAKQALMRAWTHAYVDRRRKKRERRSLWQIQISAVCKENGTSYSKFIAGLKKNNIEVDRKILADFANKNPAIFAKVLEASKA
ncbi:MAG: 50S ribosomal protein L20 [Candidatus Pacebacteria bacterium]|nr:50S ribosomal protein L20 [Candidatus Paceibacterota bacterium]